MKIWLYATMRDEADLLPYWLRHYQAVADKIIVYDHHSQDATPSILKSAGVEVRSYMPETIDDGNWAAFLSEQYKEARYHADFVIVVDADEFLHSPRGLRGVLQEHCDAGAQFVPTMGYTMIADGFPTGSGNIYDELKMGVSDHLYSKPCVFSPSLDVQFVPGKHKMYIATEPVIRPDIETPKLLHYRYFGSDWLRKRNERNYKHLSERAARMGWGFHVRPENTGMYSEAWYRAQKPEMVVP